jgi:GT2 family glycosyltransferase
MKDIDLSIIIINYKTKDITLDCLKAIFASQTKYVYEVILVDNASKDDSVVTFKDQKLAMTIIENPKNGGFANGNNIGAKSASGRYLWLLNSDTIIKRDTIQKLVSFADKSKSSLATCALLNADGSVQPQGGALPNAVNLTTWMLNLDAVPLLRYLIPPYQLSAPYPKKPQLGWVSGTAMLVRRDLYEELGGLDENIFMYGEDVEFCLRARSRGIYPDYAVRAEVVHLGQRSSSSERAIIGEITGLKYIYKKHNPSQHAYLRFILKVGTLLRIASFALMGDTKRRDIYAKAHKMV